jgi:hypothetical protein
MWHFLLAAPLKRAAGQSISSVKKLHDDFSIGHATIQPEIDGLCRMGETETLYCKTETHAQEAGHSDQEY